LRAIAVRWQTLRSVDEHLSGPGHHGSGPGVEGRMTREDLDSMFMDAVAAGDYRRKALVVRALEGHADAWRACEQIWRRR